MTNAEVLTLLMGRLVRTAPTLRALVLLELNEKIRQLERSPSKPWFLEKEVVGVFTIGVAYIDLPADFLEEVEEGAFRVQGVIAGMGDPPEVDIDDLHSETDNTAPGMPEGYALFAERIYVGPLPDAAYGYKLKYFGRTDPILDDDLPVTNKWLLEFFNFTTLSVLMIVARTHLQSMEMATKLEPELQLAQGEFWRAVEARKHASRTYLRGNSEN